MAVTGTSMAAAATMLAAAAAIFITFVICFYLFLCAKRYHGAAPTIGGGRGRARFVFAGPGGASCHGGGGIDEAAIAALPRKEVGEGDDPSADCAVCITELALGEAARVLPRCGHGFHVECVDMWLRSHSTCPLCRCAVVDDDGGGSAKAVRPPEADQESTNVLFFGSQDAVSTRGFDAATTAGAAAGTGAATGARIHCGRRGGGQSCRSTASAWLRRRHALTAAATAAAGGPRLGVRARRRREQRVPAGEVAVRFLILVLAAFAISGIRAKASVQIIC